MKEGKDPYRFKENTQRLEERDQRIELESYCQNSFGTMVEKLQNFPKYVPRASMTRYLARVEVFRQVLDVQGSVIECGVLFGGSFMTWAKASAIFEPLNSQRQVIGFDTFSGFPQLSQEDATGTSSHSKASGLGDEMEFVPDDLGESIRLFDSDRQLSHIPKVEVIQGDVIKTLPAYLEQNPHTIVSLLHLDLDIYEPTKAALKNVLPRMPRGAVIAFDELNAKHWPGESIAAMEELDLSKHQIRRFSWDTYFSYIVL